MAADLDQCRFRVLGPVQVATTHGTVVFRRRQQVDLLALLLLNVDRVLSAEAIVYAMWGEATPRTASTQIKNMVSELRRSLVDGSRSLVVLDHQPAGYRLRIADGQLDLALFTSLRTQASAEAAPDSVVRILRRALDLWLGDALSGVRAHFADAARTHLSERRMSALEDMFDAELECANHSRIVPELASAVADHPGRERLAGQLMLALYRGGRTTDALAVYRRVRQTLADDFGVEPGTALRELERAILLGDPALEVPPPRRTVTATPGPPAPAQLPPDINGFVGRSDELAKLDKLVSGQQHQPTAIVISAVTGTAGIGKTALAVHWAHRVADLFPDGQLHVNLRGFDPEGSVMSPAEAVRGFLDAFGIPPERIPSTLHAQAALYRSLVVGRRLLVVLDNAANAEQVRPLLPGGPGCLVLVTSRSRLVSLVASEGAVPITLDLLSDVEARDLIVSRLGADRVAREEPAVAEIATRCARLPLALAVVAARATVNPTFPLASLSAELSRAQGTLEALAGSDAASDVRTVFSWSYQRLTGVAARLFRLLGLHSGPDISLAATASLTGLPVAQVRPQLAELTDAHLVAEPQPGRYAMHDLLRAYAVELVQTLDSADERRAAVRRTLDHYLHTASAAADLLYSHRYRVGLMPPGARVTIEALVDQDEALAWFTAEHRVLVAAVEQAAEGEPSTYPWQLASTIATYFHRRCHWLDWESTQQSALAAAGRAADRVGQAQAYIGLGTAQSCLGDYDLAQTYFGHALALYDDLGDQRGQAHVHMRLTTVCERRAAYADGLRHAEQALELYRATGHRPGFPYAMNTIGWFHATLGHYQEAIAYCEQAVELHQESGDRQGTGQTLDSLGYAYHQLGEYEEAARYYRQSAELVRDTSGGYEAIALTHLGDSYRAAGRTELAREAWLKALRILDALSHPDAEQVTAKLRLLDA